MVGKEDTGANPRIEVEPDRALVDEPVSIRLRGFDPRKQVTLKAETVDESGVEWVSYAIFATDSSGQVDLGTASPSSGTYDGTDAMGLIWSMRPAKKEKMPSAFKAEKLDPQAITLTAEIGGQDMVWPSDRLSQIAVERLATANHIYPYQHLTYKDAGHGIGMPYRPTTVNQTVTFAGTVLGFGGSPRENARSNADYWPKIMEFLQAQLKG